MQETISASSIEPGATVARWRLKGFIVGCAVAGAAIVAFGFLFNRATVLSYSIGYNLYAAERVLAGEVPYRDFFTLYPPGTLYLNVLLFKCLGISLYSAMFGVFAFKVLTIFIIYLSAREVLPRSWSVAAALVSLFWLRPNGAFKAVPMQYGALFLALALLMLLKNEKNRRPVYLFVAGIAIGFLTLFKHNIGAYGCLGCIVFFVFAATKLKSEQDDNLYRRALITAGGVASVVLPVASYMFWQNALGSMTRTLVFGPGEFLATRLVLPRSPIVPTLFLVVLSTCIVMAYRFRRHPAASILIWALLLIGVSVFSIGSGEFAMNKLIFYLPPMIFAVALLGFVLNRRIALERRREILLALVFAVAAFVELFPRFAREQSIGAMPFVILLLLVLIDVSRTAIRIFTGGEWQSRLAIAAVTLPFLLLGARLLHSVYFDRSLRFVSDTQLQAARGHGVYFPEATARHIDEVISYIQQRVPPDGYIFAQSNSGSPYLFLAARKNPSNAQFWGGAGITAQQRAATLEEIDRRQVKLIITNDEVLASEKYDALREYIDRNFKASARFDDVIILER